MAERVGIVAVAQTKYEKSKPGLREAELVYEVVEKVLKETGLTYAEDGSGIDAAVTCSSDHWDGVTISNWPIADVTGGHRRAEEKVAGDGALAASYAFVQILSGHFDTVLVVAHTKESQTAKNAIENYGLDPIYHRMLGLDFLSSAALQANRYMYKYGVTAEQCAKVVVKSRRNAMNNPYAQLTTPVNIEDVLNSGTLAYPIKLLDAKPVSDGACAMILAREGKAKRITSKPVWIRGIGSCYDVHYLGDRDLADCDSLILAAKRAYTMAGINDPLSQIDAAEVGAEYSYQELLWTEGLGFCPRGEGGKLVDAGVTEITGKLPVNPSGGMLSGRPTGVSGLAGIAEAVLQIQGKASAGQVAGVKTALAHSASGPCGQMHCVMVLGS